MEHKSEIAVAITQLSKGFNGVEILKDISLEVEKGTTVSILGSSGAGKSTLLRCINWLETPDGGYIEINGERIGIDKNGKAQSKKALAQIRSKTAMVFQDFNLWPHLTVLGNVIEAPIHVLKVPRAQAIAEAKNYLKRLD